MFNDTRALFTIITLVIIIFCFSSIVNYYREHNTDTIIRSNSVIASLRSNPFKNKKIINFIFKNDKSKKSKIYVKLNNHNFLEYTSKLYNVITIYNQTILKIENLTSDALISLLYIPHYFQIHSIYGVI